MEASALPKLHEVHDRRAQLLRGVGRLGLPFGDSGALHRLDHAFRYIHMDATQMMFLHVDAGNA